MSYSISGAVHRIGEVQQVTDTFRKRDLVVKVSPEGSKYDEYILLEAQQDNVELMDKLKEGDAITANFDLRGREFTAKDGTVKCFNTLRLWAVAGAQKTKSTKPVITPVDEPTDGTDDLPF